MVYFSSRFLNQYHHTERSIIVTVVKQLKVVYIVNVYKEKNFFVFLLMLKLKGKKTWKEPEVNDFSSIYIKLPLLELV